MTQQGLIIIYTGNGKGKTTAAFGQALRAAGHGLRICIIQFMKGKWQTGEAKAMAALADRVELHIKGVGFTWQQKNMDEVTRAAHDGWELAREKIASDQYDMVILEELTYLISFNILAESEVLEVLRSRPPRLHVLITGRNAGKGLIEAADLVTEMHEIKHHFQSGAAARKGIEF